MDEPVDCVYFVDFQRIPIMSRPMCIRHILVNQLELARVSIQHRNVRVQGTIVDVHRVTVKINVLGQNGLRDLNLSQNLNTKYQKVVISQGMEQYRCPSGFTTNRQDA